MLKLDDLPRQLDSCDWQLSMLTQNMRRYAPLKTTDPDHFIQENQVQSPNLRVFAGLTDKVLVFGV